MKIGVAGPVTLPMLAHHVCEGEELPPGYKFAPMATWVEALLARGHQVSLFTSAPELDEPRTFKGDRLTIHVGRYRPRHRARDFFATERQDLLAAMRADPCDIIHAHWTYEFAWAALDSGRPVLVTAHDAPLQIFRFKPDPYRFIRLLMAWHVIRRTQFMTAVSDHIATHFRRVFRYRGNMRTIHNALTDNLFASSMQCGAQTKTRFLTFATVLVGWGKLKNNVNVLAAFQRVRGTLPEARLVMFGEDHGVEEKAQLWARANGMDGGVEFAGMVPHGQLVERLVSEADVLVHPSLEEACPMAVSEAMALGIPVIGGRLSGGVPEILDYGLSGILVDVSSPKNMAHAMLSLADAEVRSNFSEKGRRSARDKFNPAAVFSAYEDAYQEVLDNCVAH